jgi:GxxExxY protein
MAERDSQTGAVLGAAVEVHKTLGHGFLETVYQEAMAQEFGRRDIPFRAQVPMRIYYKGERLGCGYRADFICFGSVLVELKAQSGLTEIDDAQVINYLRATDLERALLLNYGTMKLEVRRLIVTQEYKTGLPQSTQRPNRQLEPQRTQRDTETEPRL